MVRIVVTGLGAITPVGNSVPEMWNAVVSGRSGVVPITHFDASEYSTRIAAQVKDFSPEPYMSRKEARRLDALLQFAVVAAGQAVNDAQIDRPELDRGRVGVLIGAGIGGMRTMIDAHTKLLERGPSSISPFFIPSIIANIPGGIVAQKYGLTGPNFSITSACATGNHAIGEAAEIIRRGTADVMVCGSGEAAIVELGIGGFCAMRAMTTQNDDPEHACKPFDLYRDGFVMGEGAAVLVLESLEHARRRGARIYAELTGYGTTSDAYHLVAPDPDGKGAAEAMHLALESAQLAPGAIGYINAHGTGTDLNDKIETNAIKTVFGDAAYDVAISSTKPVTGHLLGGAGAVEAVISILALVHNLIPPTINLTTPDPECDLDYVPLVARPAPLHAVMSNGFGFGGHNASVIFQTLD
ncbi:MAG: beta-ketoacyl-ACP synthase II [Anaerolineae bacterium]|nr:beta-ketoacyl-ACP synthase II [Anaerolineae bacterium]